MLTAEIGRVVGGRQHSRAKACQLLPLDAGLWTPRRSSEFGAGCRACRSGTHRLSRSPNCCRRVAGIGAGAGSVGLMRLVLAVPAAYLQQCLGHSVALEDAGVTFIEDEANQGIR